MLDINLYDIVLHSKQTKNLKKKKKRWKRGERRRIKLVT